MAIALATNVCVDINTAPKGELEKIVQIGESRAQQIIKLREERLFSSINDLNRIIGLGESRISAIKKQDLACVANGLTAESQLAEVRLPLAEVGLQSIAPKPLYASLLAFTLAIFSGAIILFLKKRLT